MNTTATTDLMQAVLDGQATPDEARELEQRLASDARARAEFDALRRMFDDLGRVPPRLPPEDLQARLLARVHATTDQPLAGPRVIGSSPLRDRLSKLISTLRHTFTADPDWNGADMKKIWIGAAVAVVAVVGVAQFGLGGKTNDKDVTGTIAPAERYRAAQPTATDVEVSRPKASTGQPPPPPPEGTQANNGAAANAGGAAANAGGAAANAGGAAANAGGAAANAGGAAANAGGAAANAGGAAANMRASNGAAANAGGAAANAGGAAANAGGAAANAGGAAANMRANSGAAANAGGAAANAGGAAANASSNKQ